MADAIRLSDWVEMGERAGLADGEVEPHALRRQRQVWLGAGEKAAWIGIGATGSSRRAGGSTVLAIAFDTPTALDQCLWRGWRGWQEGRRGCMQCRSSGRCNLALEERATFRGWETAVGAEACGVGTGGACRTQRGTQTLTQLYIGPTCPCFPGCRSWCSSCRPPRAMHLRP